jgi:FixJ family two-component response regulator
MGSGQQQPIDVKSTAPVIHVVDGDQGVQHGVRSLLGTLGVAVRCYSSAEQFLDTVDLGLPGCVITEVHLPGISGLDLQEALRRRGVDYPVIVLASDADVPIAVRAMALGAVDFIEKPFVDRVLIARVKQALRTTSAPDTRSRSH